MTITAKGERALRVKTLQDAIGGNQSALEQAKEQVVVARARVKDLNKTLHRQGLELTALIREGA